MSADRRLLVGIDGGTQSTKVLVFDITGRVIAQGIRALRPMSMPTPGQFEHPDDDLWESLKVACHAAMVQLGERADDIVGVGLCSIRFCRALLRSDGELAHPVLSWMDARVGRPHEQRDDVAYVSAASAYLTARLPLLVVNRSNERSPRASHLEWLARGLLRVRRRPVEALPQSFRLVKVSATARA